MVDSTSRELKFKLKRIVAMLTRVAKKFDDVKASSDDYAVVIDYEHDQERDPKPV